MDNPKERNHRIEDKETNPFEGQFLKVVLPVIFKKLYRNVFLDETKTKAIVKWKKRTDLQKSDDTINSDKKKLEEKML